MDRKAWLAERRAAVLAEYDEIAAKYDSLGYPVTLQAGFVARVAGMCPPDGIVLDAPCGTGKYFAIVAAAGRRVAGIDQSAGMLAQAARKGIAETLAQVTKLKGEVQIVAPGSLPNDGTVIADERSYG
jgi:ubiquinone/menaquinone biosynthesis C-methylase UbiE